MQGIAVNRLYIDTYLNEVTLTTEPICQINKAVLFVVGGETPATTFIQGGQMYVYNVIAVNYKEALFKNTLKMSNWYWYASVIALLLVPNSVSASKNPNDISVKYSDYYSNFNQIWSGDTSFYEISEESGARELHQVGGETNGANIICRPSDVAFGQWEFSVTFDGFQTSNQNHALVWIQRSAIDIPYGILVRIGENGSMKRIRLLASDPNGTTTELLASGQPLPGDLTTVHVQLTRTPTSHWMLRYRFNTSDQWHSDQVTHPADLHAQSLFCLGTRFTPTRANKFRFGPIITSTHTTFLSHYSTPAPNQLHLHFSKPLPPDAGSTASVQIDGYTGSVSASTYLNTLRLRLNPAPGGGNRRLVVSNLYDYETSISPINITTQIQWFDAAHPLDIVINEFTPRPATPNDAFIELLNTSDRYININNWTIGRSSTTRTITHSRAVAPGDFVVVQRDPPPDPHNGEVHFIESSIFPIGMTTDKLFLRDADGQLIDSLYYSTSISSDWISGKSIEKKSPTYAGMDPENWAQNLATNSMGTTNNVNPLIFHSDLPEMAVNITADSIGLLFDRFIQWNSESKALIGSVQLELPEWDPFTSNKLIIPKPHDITLHTTQITLNLNNVLSYQGQYTFSVQQESAQPPRPEDLILNEILYQPLKDRYATFSDQSQFIEIHNTAPWKISLRNVIIRDPIDKHGQFSSIAPDNPELWAIEGNGFALIVPDTASSIENSRTAQFFGLLPDASWGHVRRSELSLNTTGKPVILSLADGTTLDSIHYSPDYHNPLLREQKGISLERVGGDIPSSQAHWTSSADPLGATPGFLNSVSISISDQEVQSGFQFHPNPFSPNHDGIDDVIEITLFSENIDRFSRITIFDLGGRRVKTLLNDGLTGRISSVIWDGTDERGILLPTGIYIVLAESYNPQSKKTQKHKKPLVLVRTR